MLQIAASIFLSISKSDIPGLLRYLLMNAIKPGTQFFQLIIFKGVTA